MFSCSHALYMQSQVLSPMQIIFPFVNYCSPKLMFSLARVRGAAGVFQAPDQPLQSTKQDLEWTFPGGPVVGTPRFQCRRHGFDPYVGEILCHGLWSKNNLEKRKYETFLSSFLKSKMDVAWLVPVDGRIMAQGPLHIWHTST